MDHPVESTPPGDLSALAWVHDELRRTLDTAHKSLRRHLRDLDQRPTISPSLDEATPPALLQARALVHQAAGALDLICLPAPARCLQASEQALQQLSASPGNITVEQVATIERGSFAVLDYLQRLLAGQIVSPLAMFPQYKAVQALAAADRVHPADLWSADLPADPGVIATPATPLLPDARVHAAMEAAMLDSIRGGAEAQRRMSRLFAGLAAGSRGRLASAWHLASAFFEAQAAGLLAPDVYSQRLVSRLLAQLRSVERGQTEVPDRLLQDLQFFCARAAEDGTDSAPQLARVRAAFGLPNLAAADYSDSPLGRFDPLLVPQARRRVSAFKDIWAVAAAGDAAVLQACAEQAVLVAESVRQLYPGGERLGQALQASVAGPLAAASAPGPELAMEVATALLCLDASLDELDMDRPELAQRIQRLSERLERAAGGQPPEPIEPWMEALYRDVSDRQTMGSVVQELRASLAEVEQQLDRFHRHPAEHDLLIPVPSQLSAMRGVLSVLGLGPASQAVLRMREDVDTIMAGQGPAADAAHVRLADNVGALSFLIDMLGVQPQLAKSLFRFDADSGRFSAVMGRGAARSGGGPELEPRLMERVQELAEGGPALSHDDLSRQLDALAHQAVAADESALADTAVKAREALAHAEGPAEQDAVRADLAQAFSSLTQTSQPVVPAPQPLPAPGDDEDMREVFFEEADEVLAQAREALDVLGQRPDDLEAMTSVRRAFHTLKGSARMVGLREYGELAWACEQLYNTRLAWAEAQSDAVLGDFTGRALDELQHWVSALARGDAVAAHDGQALVQEATLLRNPPQVPPPLSAAPAESDHAADAAAAVDTRTVPDALGELGEPAEAADTAEPTERMPLGDERPEDDAMADIGLDLDLDLGQLPEPASALTIDLPLDEVPAPEADEARDDSHWARTEAQLPAELAPAEVDFELDLAALDAPTAEVPVDITADWPDLHLPLADEPDAATPGTLADELPSPAPETAEAAAPSVQAADGGDAVAMPPQTLAGQDLAMPADDADRYKIVGPLRVPIALFNIFLNEADEQSRRLGVELAEWQHELDRPVPDTAVALAHSLAGNSATVGYVDLSALARRLEHVLERSHARGHGRPPEAQLFLDVAEEIRRLLHQFAAGFLKPLPVELDERLARQEVWDAAQVSQHAAPGSGEVQEAGAPRAAEPALGEVRFSALKATEAALSEADLRAPAGPAEALPSLDLLRRDLDAVDALDPELFPIFAEEAQELVPTLSHQVRQWEQDPAELGAGVAAMRALHTLKGGARLAGAMRLGEMAHRLETAVEQLTARGVPDLAALAPLHAGVDALAEELERLLGAPAAVAELAPMAVAPAPALPDSVAPEAAPPDATADDALPLQADQPTVDWERLARATAARALPAAAAAAAEGVTGGSVRVRAALLDRLVSHAGEVGIARGRIENDVSQMRGQLRELTDNLERLRRQLRDLELQAETQMASRMEAARHAQQAFDPLEMDRFTRVQELTRMMAESVSDVGTVQRGLQQALQSSEDQLAAQARLTRDLQDDLLRARMVEFDTLSDRLYRVVRQAAKESAKQVRLNLVGGAVEMDRGVLDRMAPAFEHLLRNAVVHGIEPPALREALGKDAAGTIEVSLRQVGNEVRVEVRDDGAGLDLPRIAERAKAAGLLQDDDRPTEADLAGLIFRAGFTTADEVTELAGRGIGMDVVRSEVTAMGGRVETASAAGRGTAFQLVLPLTTAVTQVVAVDCSGMVVAVPSTLVELVRRVPVAEVDAAYANGVLQHGERELPFFWLGGLLQHGERGPLEGRTAQVLIVRSASQRVAVHVSAVLGNQEVVVKNLGPQLSRLPGLAGMSLLGNGETVLIYNPVALAAIYGDEARRRLAAAPQAAAPQPGAAASPAAAQPQAPLILVVDDSLTVRRVTQRLLQREGYRVALARDGLEALEQLASERPAVMLSDIEMPRMDGFDLVRNVRADGRWHDLPVIMITSRIAQKHREHAHELGVDHYLGKPYDEDALLALLRDHLSQAAPVSR